MPGGKFAHLLYACRAALDRAIAFLFLQPLSRLVDRRPSPLRRAAPACHSTVISYIGISSRGPIARARTMRAPDRSSVGRTFAMGCALDPLRRFPVKVRTRGRYWKSNLCPLPVLPSLLVASATGSDAQTKAYVTHSGANIVTVIDTKTSAVTGTIPVGSYPSTVVVNRDGTFAFVANGGSSSVTVIDTACDPATDEAACVVRTIPVGDGPSDLVVSPDGQWLYVMTSSGVVQVVGTDGTSVGPTYDVGAAGALGISPDGSRVYVAAGPVYVINTDDKSIHSFAPE